ncbi:hypothetical protein BYT27DRAFT_7333934 [Phlegmacium glaucopus]|nr:hypothetical protein BYT27DRAFT_7333934 [Phlegmacium glaucopus]
MTTTTTTTVLPRDIWLHVAQFLPGLFLCDLISLNSTFFEIAMDYRYRQMSFAYFDNRMIRSLSRLRDPAVAKRVRILHIYPGFIKETLDRDKLEPILRRSLRHRLVDLLEQKLSFNCKHPKYRLLRTLKTTEDVVRIMLEVLRGLPNITDYYVTWCGLPYISATAIPFVSTVFQANLRKLSLNISLENVTNLMGPSFYVQNLEELHLCIHSENIDSAFERSEIMGSHFAPAISRHRSTLQILIIESWKSADLSPLFRAIDRLPALQDLSVAIPIEAIHLGDPEGLTHFLNMNQSNLRNLRLRATQYGGLGLTPDPISFDSWVKDAIKGVKLAKLRVLDIPSNLFPVDASTFCLRQFSHTITSLSLTGCYRSYDDVDEALNFLNDPLRRETLNTLRISLISLSPQLLDLISKKLPKLSRLGLVARYALPHATDTPQFKVHRQGEIQIDEFVTIMEKREYPDWQLSHMSVLVECLPFRPEYEALLEQTFLHCIPSIRTYT